MGKYKKLGKNVLLLTVGNFASKLLSFFLVPFYTAVLTVEEYGVADIVTTTVNLILPFFTLLVYEAILRYALDKTYDTKQILTIGLFVNTIGLGIFLLFSPIGLLNSVISEYYVLFILYYVTSSYCNIISQYVKGIEQVGLYTGGGVLNTFLVIIFNIFFLLIMNKGIVGYLTSFILAHFIVSIFWTIKIKIYKQILPIKKVDSTLLKNMLQYSLPMIPNALSWWVSDSSDKYILTMFKGVVANGLYSVAYKIPTLLTTITTIFMSAWQISAVDEFGSEKNRLFFSDIYRKYASFTILLSGGLITFSKWIASFLYSKDFFEAWVYTPVLLLAFVFNALSAFLGSIFTTAKKTKVLLYSTLIGAGVNILLNFMFIPWWGGMGAAVATLISYMTVWSVRLVNSRKIMILNIELRKNLLSYILIILQITITCMDLRCAILLSAGIECVLFGINIQVIKDILNLIFKKRMF